MIERAPSRRPRHVAALFAACALALPACGDEEKTTTVTERVTMPSTTTSQPSTSSTTSSTTTSTTSTGSTTTREDVSGNCDEAEHADDPECSGGVQAGDGPTSGGYGPD